MKIYSIMILSILFAFTACSFDNKNSLIEEREGFKTKIIKNVPISRGELPIAPAKIFKVIKYKSDVGSLSAYVSPAPADNKKHPAILWAHGGFGGLGKWAWEGKIKAFIDAGFIVMVPSWRAENNNPGTFELFYGELNDALNALKYLSKLKYVNANRIYMAGHSTGGTLTLLASQSKVKVRAFFSFGGAPDLYKVVSNGQGYGNTPYDFTNTQESYYRSPINFVKYINAPTFYFEGEQSFYVKDAIEMEEDARFLEKNFHTYIIKGGNHMNILMPIVKLIMAPIYKFNLAL